MSFRLRLTIWYGVLTGIFALLFGGMTYAAHVRAHYEEIDQQLLEISQTYLEDAAFANGPLTPPADPSTVVRIYDGRGFVAASTPFSDSAPAVSPVTVLAEEAGPPYDFLARLVPISTFSVQDGGGEFGVVETGDDVRWRTHVTPVAEGDRYIVTLASLAELDHSVEEFRLLVLALLLVGGIITLCGGWLLAGSALRPVNTVTETAGALADSQAFDRRVPVQSEDEIGRLSATFNRMLDNLEIAHQLQQRFVADASHELRAPLTAVHANLEILERHPDLPLDVRQEATSEANQEVRHLSRLVSDLLELAKADVGLELTFKPVELDRVVLDALHQCRALARDRELEIENLQPAMIMGDADRLRQLVVILVDNALRYTPESGEVNVSTTQVGDMIHITVRDTGIGIAPEDLPHVRERFYRSDRARTRDPGGTGLGLSIASWIVDQHHGKLQIDSRQGEGTTVIVELPNSKE